ncbi:MAG: DUF5610 domain-containing protein [Planctomycetota bacterium]|nr:DUF5610 domain-containing protein [Planctomycetota bacterium]
MIDSEMNSQLSRYFNRSSQAETNTAADIYKRLKARNDTIKGKTNQDEEKTEEEAAVQTGKPKPRDLLDLSFKKKSQTATPQAVEEKLSAEERRQKELKAILDKLNAEEAERSSVETSPTESTTGGVLSPDMSKELGATSELSGFLNDLPLFGEFKAGLMDAFKMMDKGSLGSISAQYELNFSSMQYVSDAAGAFSYKETSISMKLDLSYIKASAGKSGGGQAIADLIGQAGDFPSLLQTLSNAASGTATGAGTQPTANDFITQMQDYFSPEKTAERIVDFATAFFPNSQAFKSKGDTEEGRGEFAEMMRAAIQKGFDQAMGVLGKVPAKVQEDIDKTHELTFNGIDDFVKNGLNRQKQNEGLYSSLEQWNLSFSLNYGERTVRIGSKPGNALAPSSQGQEIGGTLNLQA